MHGAYRRLVSHGYVVAAIENTYMAAAVVFPDGRVIPSYYRKTAFTEISTVDALCYQNGD